MPKFHLNSRFPHELIIFHFLFNPCCEFVHLLITMLPQLTNHHAAPTCQTGGQALLSLSGSHSTTAFQEISAQHFLILVRGPRVCFCLSLCLCMLPSFCFYLTPTWVTQVIEKCALWSLALCSLSLRLVLLKIGEPPFCITGLFTMTYLRETTLTRCCMTDFHGKRR